MSLNKRQVRWIFLSGFVTFCVTAAPLLWGLVYYGVDLTWVDTPFICELKNHLAARDSFFISRYFGNGEPLLANPQSQLFYPIRWIQLLFFSSDLGPSVGNVLHWSLAASGAAALALSFGIEGFFAFLAGLFFVFSGTVLNLGEHTTYILGGAWLPWIWMFGRRILAASKIDRNFFGLVFASGFCLIGGDPLGFFMGFMCLATECLLVLARRTYFPVFRVAGAYALGMLLCAVQWIPSLSELGISIHGVGHNMGMSLDWAMETPHWLGVVLPEFAARIVRSSATVMEVMGTASGLSLQNAGWNWNMRPYLGLLLVCFAASSFLARRYRTLSIVAAVGAVLCVGGHTRVLPFLLEHVAPFGHFRYPQKYFLLFNLAACILGAATLYRASREPKYRRKLGLGFGVMVVALIGTMVAAYLHGDAIDAWSVDIIQRLGRNKTGLGDSFSHVLLKSLLTPVATALAAALLLLSNSRVHRLLPFVALLDLMILTPAQLMFSPSFTQSRSPLTKVKKTPGIPGEPVYCFNRKLYEISIGYKEDDPEEKWGQYFSTKLLGLPNLNACDRLISGSPYSVMTSAYRYEFENGVSKNRISAARALGCTHMMTPEVPQEKDARIVDVPGFGELAEQFGSGPALYLVDDPVPLVFASKSPRVFSDPRDLIVGVSQSRSAADVLSWIDDPVGLNAGGVALPDSSGVADLRVQWTGEDFAQVDVRGSGGSIVGLRSTYAVGWEAYQAGNRLPTVRIAGSFIGAIVADIAAGPVEFRYRPPYFTLGAWISGLSLSLIVLLLLFIKKKPRNFTVFKPAPGP
ncbi:MAG: hypothetical protein JST80_09225 [Bdellovibrionales bacterium]|nr:hypothetical protein [Bdellovibrionales bacterium]